MYKSGYSNYVIIDMDTTTWVPWEPEVIFAWERELWKSHSNKEWSTTLYMYM